MLRGMAPAKAAPGVGREAPTQSFKRSGMSRQRSSLSSTASDVSSPGRKMAALSERASAMITFSVARCLRMSST